ncbi:glycosyltransferase family 9 protein [Bacillus luteolus]|uniref:Glycosyltransferase family 9 protein n=1 Tax=Litchfieldia luteola TaxID=682179 RepID=A0ABR9QFM2_9BACI|nr:glycosyltransferase family 9 protein [Cytobacillus luteolus]MBE4907216.1 glycosyltransferase family 9 protein [Cytobacillus luteolus]MBP1943308.1 heptosyltransferase I [Cytobacillus luteolus]
MNERGNTILKRMDTYIGIPLVFLLSLLRRRKREIPQDPQSIVIIMIAAIGDTILLSSILKELRYLYPNAVISIVCSKGNIQAAKNLQEINDIVTFDLSKIMRSFLFLKKQRTFNLLLDFGAWSKLNAIISYMIKADYKVGFKRKRMYRHYLYDRTAEHLDTLHELENYRNLLRSLGCRLQGFLPEFVVSSKSSTKVNRIVDPNQRYIVFHLFASGSHKEKKEWHEDYWIELAHRFICEDYHVLFTGGPQDQEETDRIVRKVASSECISLAGKLSLEETAILIKKVNLIVTVNTGVMHLAAALETRIIALHGPTSPDRWGPVSDKAVILTPQIKCDSLLSLGFEQHQCVIKEGCISTISVDEVYRAVKYYHENGEKLAKTSNLF